MPRIGLPTWLALFFTVSPAFGLTDLRTPESIGINVPAVLLDQSNVPISDAADVIDHAVLPAEQADLSIPGTLTCGGCPKNIPGTVGVLEQAAGEITKNPAGAAAVLDKAIDGSASKSFANLAEDYWNVSLRLSPIGATYNNIPGLNGKLDDISPAGMLKSRNAMRRIQARLRKIDRSALNESEKISYDLLDRELKTGFEAGKFHFERWEVDHLNGIQATLPQLMDHQPMGTEQDAKDLLSRMSQIPKMLHDHIAHLKRGMKDGTLSAKRPVEHTIETLEFQVAEKMADTPYVHAANRLPVELQAEYRPLIEKSFERNVRPALQRYLNFLKYTYLPKARPDDKAGLLFIPRGKEMYQYQIRRHTTLDMTAEQLHQLGLTQLDENHARMLEIAKQMGHEGDLQSFLDKISKDPKNFYSSREEILEDARNLVAEIKRLLPKFFGILPKTDMVVEPIEAYREKSAVGAEYSGPPDDLSRPGKYYINTYEPQKVGRWDKRALAAHEGVPGHHLQITIALEQRGLPAFRRNMGFTAFVEGWAHYTELLAEEMGIYKDPLSLIGMLASQSFRAARLVVDTGIHALGWDRQKAIDFMVQATGMPLLEVENEIDRYMDNGFWPGQALAYKVGQLEISKLRVEAQQKFGDKFDARKFHDAVLKNGALPLPMLRRIVLTDLGAAQ